MRRTARTCRGSARPPGSTGPISGFRIVRLMWSAIIISAPRLKVRRTPPAALVRIRVSTPRAANDPHRQDRESRPDAPRTDGSGRSAPGPASAERARHQLARVAYDGRTREAGNLGVRDPHRSPSRSARRPETRSEDDRGSRFQMPEPRSHRAAAPPPRRHRAHSRMPAIVADRKLASVPASMARKPRRARSSFRSGASAPMPPS